jgi:hypothetical protein
MLDLPSVEFLCLLPHLFSGRVRRLRFFVGESAVRERRSKSADSANSCCRRFAGIAALDEVAVAKKQATAWASDVRYDNPQHLAHILGDRLQLVIVNG